MLMLLISLACSPMADDTADTAAPQTFEHFCGSTGEDFTYPVAFPVQLETSDLADWGILVYWAEGFQGDGHVTLSRELTLNNLGQPTTYCVSQDVGVFSQELLVLTEL